MTSLGIAGAIVGANLTVVWAAGPVGWVGAYFASLILLLAVMLRRDRMGGAR